MVTIKEILNLAKYSGLKSCRFLAGDPANVPVIIDEHGKVFFEHKNHNIEVTETKREDGEIDIEKIDMKNEYYLEMDHRRCHVN